MKSEALIRTFKQDTLQVEIFSSAEEAGKRAASLVADQLEKSISQKGKANLLLATGASQFAFLDALKETDSIEWDRITTFHLDEYLGLPEAHPASFRKYLKERILDEVKPGQAHFLEGDAPHIEGEIERYEDLIRDHPIDVGCIGIGENGHIAFNDPPVADFNDPKWVKIVELDQACRNQQLGEGWFTSFEEVPTHALTMTIPAIMSCKAISCFVPDKRKGEAVFNTLYGPVSTSCPASILRRHPHAILFLDEEAAVRIK